MASTEVGNYLSAAVREDVVTCRLDGHPDTWPFFRTAYLDGKMDAHLHIEEGEASYCVLVQRAAGTAGSTKERVPSFVGVQLLEDCPFHEATSAAMPPLAPKLALVITTRERTELRSGDISDLLAFFTLKLQGGFPLFGIKKGFHLTFERLEAWCCPRAVEPR